ncbi:hypothetical protein MPER_05317, partial [Moniliophthora perniciosa FA553]
MAKDVFSVPIFFIVFRETLEAAIIISVLLGLAEQIVNDRGLSTTTNNRSAQGVDRASEGTSEDGESHRSLSIHRKLTQVIEQILLGAGLGLLLALAIGAALMIFVMGVSMLTLERAKAKWRIKLQ